MVVAGGGDIVEGAPSCNDGGVGGCGCGGGCGLAAHQVDVDVPRECQDSWTADGALPLT